MRDPHVHVEQHPIFSHGLLREVLSDTLGLALDAPKTVTTGCGQRRPYAMTSTNPDAVTCLACRYHADTSAHPARRAGRGHGHPHRPGHRL